MDDKDPYAATAVQEDPYAATAGVPPPAQVAKPTWKDKLLAKVAPLSPETRQTMATPVMGGSGPTTGEAADAALGAAHGIGSIILHPYDTAKETLNAAGDLLASGVPGPERERTIQRGKDIAAHFKENPFYATGEQLGPIAAGEAVGGLGEVARAAKEAPVEASRSTLLKTGRRITQADTAVKEAVGKAAEKQTADTAAMTEVNKALEDQRARRRQVEQNVQDKTQALEQQTNQIKASAKAKNDANWETVREKVGDQPVDLGEVSSTIKAQEAKMDPNSQAIFRQILKEGSAPEEVDQIRNEVMAKSKGIPSGVPYESLSPELKSVVDDVVQRQAAIEGIDPDSNSNVPFTRLQGWYTELGQKQFAGGQIPGNIYKAIDTVRKAVRKTMDDTAEAHGATDDLDAARVSNTQYQDAFGRQRTKRLSAADENLKKTNPEAFARKQAQAKIDKVAVHDPTYPDAVQQAVDAHETLKQFPSEKAISTKVQAPPDEPTVDLQKVSQAEIEKKAKNWGSFNGRDVGIFASSMLAQPIMHMLGHAGAGETIGIAAGAFMGGKMLASQLATMPSVIEFLKRPSASDLALISKIPGVDKVRVIDGFTDAAVEAAQTGKPLKIAPQTALLLGPAAMARISAASAGNQQPKSRKDLLESKP